MEESYYGIIQVGQNIEMILEHKLRTISLCFYILIYIVIYYKNKQETEPSILIYPVIERLNHEASTSKDNNICISINI
jgi:hypothetical protein